MADSRKKVLREIQGGADKPFGKGSLMLLGDGPIAQVEVVPTGSLGLDRALGVGGLPRGRVVEIYGVESGGKTTLALHVVAEAQKLGGVAAFVDAEHALDTAYARKLGVNTEELLVNQPDCGEQALEMVDYLVHTSKVDVVVVDSVAALVPRAELEGDMGDVHMGLQARLMSQAMRKLAGGVSRTNTLVIFINQIRMKIGVMFGNPETTTGGNALKFYASVRLDIRRIGAVKEAAASAKKGEEKNEEKKPGGKADDRAMIGNRTRVKVVKNKVAPPFKEVEFDIIYGHGIDVEGEVVDMAVECGVLEKNGAWYSLGGERLAQGRDNMRAMLCDQPATLERLRDAVKAEMMKPAAPAVA